MVSSRAAIRSGILFLELPVADGAHHSTLRPECASVHHVKGLSRDEGEIEPLEQLGHNHFSLHLKKKNSSVFICPCSDLVSTSVLGDLITSARLLVRLFVPDITKCLQ